MRRANRQVTDLSEIQSALEEMKVARVGMFDGKQVYVVPLNHGFEMGGDKIVFYLHGSKMGKKTDVLKEHPEVCIELDGRHELVRSDTPCTHSFYYISLIGNGIVEFVEDFDEKAHALSLVMKHQTGKDDWEFDDKWVRAVCIMKLEVTDYTVKQFKQGMRK